MLKDKKAKYVNKAYQHGIITREEYADKVNTLASTVNRVYGKG